VLGSKWMKELDPGCKFPHAISARKKPGKARVRARKDRSKNFDVVLPSNR
jgi:hypothetical protein